MLYKYSVTCWSDNGGVKVWTQHLVDVTYEVNDKTLPVLEQTIRETTGNRGISVVRYALLTAEENQR